MMTLEKPLTGAPYCEGDPISLGEVEARVLSVQHADLPQPFGRHWLVNTISHGIPRAVYVDDNGYDRTIGRMVRPSDHVED